MIRSASASSSAAEPVPRSRRPWPARSGPAPGTGPGRRRAAARRAVVPGEPRPRPTLAAVDLGPRSTVTSPRSTRGRPRQRLLQEVGRLEACTSAMPSSCAWRALSIRFWVQRVLDDHRDRAVGADQVRQQLGAAPAGDQAEEDLGQRERGRAPRRPSGSGSAGHSTPPPMAAPLTNANVGTGAVRSRRKTWWPSWPIASACSRLRMQRHAGEVGADAEDERLAGDRDERRVGRRARPSIAASRLARPPGPKVFGLVWSKPLSRVIRAAGRVEAGHRSPGAAAPA